MLEYFDNLFEEILTTEIDNNIDNMDEEIDDDDEFRYSIETIDSEYKQFSPTP